MMEKRLFMKKYFVRGIIFASICLFYSTHSLSLVRERSYFSVISNHLTAAKFLGPMLIQEWISPIYRFFDSEKIQNQENNGYYQANLPCDREHVEIFTNLPIGRYLIKKMVKSYPVAREQIIQYIVKDFNRLIKSVGGRLLIEEIIKNDLDALIESWDGRYLINAIIKNDSSESRQIISYIVNNFDRSLERWIESYHTGEIIWKIIEKCPDARQQI